MSKHLLVKYFATHFDHTDPKWVADPFPHLHELRGANARSCTPIATAARPRLRTKAWPVAIVRH